MKRGTWVLLVLICAFSNARSAQKPAGEAPIERTQKLGQRIFQQRCGVCHTQPVLGLAMYGPALYKDLIIGNETAIHDFIANGSDRMPGFKFGLKPHEIDAIVEYLKTVPKPVKPSPAKDSSQNPMD